MTDEERKNLIKSLMREKDSYARSDDEGGVERVTEELRRLGAEGEPPAKRAAKRPASDKTTEKR
jgi:hypothetical protein